MYSGPRLPRLQKFGAIIAALDIQVLFTKDLREIPEALNTTVQVASAYVLKYMLCVIRCFKSGP